MTTKKYDYTSLMRALVKELHQKPKGLTSFQIMNLFEYRSGSLTSGRSFARRVIKMTNGLLAERGYSIQYNYAMGVYQLGRNGTLVHQGRRVKVRQVRSRLITIKTDLVSVVNAHPDGSVDHQRATDALRTIDYLIDMVGSMQ